MIFVQVAHTVVYICWRAWVHCYNNGNESRSSESIDKMQLAVNSLGCRTGCIQYKHLEIYQWYQVSQIRSYANIVVNMLFLETQKQVVLL